MNTKILNILCEGSTEELFAKHILKPFLQRNAIVVKYRKVGGTGGLSKYQPVKDDLITWGKEVWGRSSETHYFTTMIDFFELPGSFPEYKESEQYTDVYAKVQFLETAFREDICKQEPRFSDCFIPYFQLHEFEALLFSDIKKLTKFYPDRAKAILNLDKVLATEYKGNPELVNHEPSKAPSKRIIHAVDGIQYDKPNIGRWVSEDIGISTLKEKCRHFNEWTDKLMQL